MLGRGLSLGVRFIFFFHGCNYYHSIRHPYAIFTIIYFKTISPILLYSARIELHSRSAGLTILILVGIVVIWYSPIFCALHKRLIFFLYIC